MRALMRAEKVLDILSTLGLLFTEEMIPRTNIEPL